MPHRRGHRGGAKKKRTLPPPSSSRSHPPGQEPEVVAPTQRAEEDYIYDPYLGKYVYLGKRATASKPSSEEPPLRDAEESDALSVCEGLCFVGSCLEKQGTYLALRKPVRSPSPCPYVEEPSLGPLDPVLSLDEVPRPRRRNLGRGGGSSQPDRFAELAARVDQLMVFKVPVATQTGDSIGSVDQESQSATVSQRSSPAPLIDLESPGIEPPPQDSSAGPSTLLVDLSIPEAQSAPNPSAAPVAACTLAYWWRGGTLPGDKPTKLIGCGKPCHPMVEIPDGPPGPPRPNFVPAAPLGFAPGIRPMGLPQREAAPTATSGNWGPRPDSSSGIRPLMSIRVPPPSQMVSRAPPRPSEPRRVRPDRCWNCGELGHRYSQCQTPRRHQFCYRCGCAGETRLGTVWNATLGDHRMLRPCPL